jgi:hemolysin activation/secretion protein
LHRSGFSLLALYFLIPASLQASEAANCVALASVDIEANEILAPSESQALIEPYLGACIDVDLTRDLLATISDDLIENGYVTSRPYLLEQDISDGQIEIRILPGIIEKIIDADSGGSNGKIATAFLFNDEILNLRELETSLEQIERVSSITANIEIRPGTQQGGSIVAIKTIESDPLKFELGANTQTDLDDQLSFLMNWDNPFNINDIFQFRLNDGELRETFQSNRSRELAYSFPLGGYLLELSHSDINFKQRVQGSNGSFLSEGDTLADKYRVSKIVARNQSNRVTLALSLEIKDTDNFFEGELVDVSSYKTSQLQLELRHDWYQPWGRLGMHYNYHQGLDSFGARDDDYFTRTDGSESEARLQFEKFSIDSRVLYYLDGPTWYLDLNLHLQYSDDILFDSDKLNLGSPYTVRGYSSALSGGNAWYLRSDITWQLESVGIPSSTNRLTKSVALSFGLDYGEVKCEIDNADVCGEIYGTGLGLVIWDSNFSARLLWGHPLKEIGDDIGDEDRFLLDLRWAL